MRRSAFVLFMVAFIGAALFAESAQFVDLCAAYGVAPKDATNAPALVREADLPASALGSVFIFGKYPALTVVPRDKETFDAVTEVSFTVGGQKTNTPFAFGVLLAGENARNDSVTVIVTDEGVSFALNYDADTAVMHKAKIALTTPTAFSIAIEENEAVVTVGELRFTRALAKNGAKRFITLFAQPEGMYATKFSAKDKKTTYKENFKNPRILRFGFNAITEEAGSGANPLEP